MSAASNAIFTEVEEDVRACEEALQRAGQQLKDKNKSWRRKRIRRTVKAEHVIQQQLQELLEKYRGMVCPETQEPVVTPELAAAIANALNRDIQTGSGMKSAIDLLAGNVPTVCGTGFSARYQVNSCSRITLASFTHAVPKPLHTKHFPQYTVHDGIACCQPHVHSLL